MTKHKVDHRLILPLNNDELGELLFLAGVVRRVCESSGTATPYNPFYRLATLALYLASPYFVPDQVKQDDLRSKFGWSHRIGRFIRQIAGESAGLSSEVSLNALNPDRIISGESDDSPVKHSVESSENVAHTH